jgi:hypothetical protein
MKTKVYKLVTKPGLTKPLLNEIKVLLKNNFDIVHETKSEVKISSVFENMICLYEKSRLIDNISVQLCRDLRVE